MNSRNQSLSLYFAPSFHKSVVDELFEDLIGRGPRNLLELVLGYHFVIGDENCEFYSGHELIEVIDSRLIKCGEVMNWND